MKKTLIALSILLICSCQKSTVISDSDYLSVIKSELKKEWPNNRTINLVFHGHSVPAGYFKTPIVNTLDSYPYQLLGELKEKYPFAVINIINTSIGGENSFQGSKRFKEVLKHNPDVIFIDYALNDLNGGLKKAEKSWSYMITMALSKGIKVILLTPSPDQRIDILDETSELQKHADQIKSLAHRYNTGIIDSYEKFKEMVRSGDSLNVYMSQVNHPNKRGHELIAHEIMKYFE